MDCQTNHVLKLPYQTPLYFLKYIVQNKNVAFKRYSKLITQSRVYAKIYTWKTKPKYLNNNIENWILKIQAHRTQNLELNDTTPL